MVRRHRVLIALVAGLALGAPGAASAQIDFSGQWTPLYHEDGPERIPGPELGDFAGLPLNDVGRLRAEAYDSARISVVTEYQCREHGGDYAMRGLSNMRILAVRNPLDQRIEAFELVMGNNNQLRMVYLDGRQHPSPNAPHTWQGFSTGTWDGNMLSITTTHLKASYTRRNGVPSSDRRTFTEQWMRHGRFGEYLTVVTITDDPVVLSEPLIRSQSWFLDPSQQVAANITCDAVPEVPAVAGREVPHYLPGTNPWLREFSETYGIPYEATRGDAAAMYPEYRRTLKQTFATIDRCTHYCTCMNTGSTCPR